MNRFLPVSALALALFAGTVAAAPINIEVPTNIEPQQSGLTRAEVIADYHMWRLAGLAELTRGEQSVDTNSYAYKKEYATYVYLRESPQYAALVAQLQAHPNSNVVGIRPDAGDTHAAK
ncbi:MAG: hypothetical protein JWQ76_2444 [Ramlibacter sp.]|nr:hypothetical protein [Ramlibacter sp.]